MSPRKNAQVAFASAVAVLLISAVAAYVTIVRLRASAHWVIHTYQVESKLGELDSSISRLARARTGFALTGDAEQVASFRGGLPTVRQKLEEIAALTSDNESQKALYQNLCEITQQRINLFTQSIALKQNSPQDSAGQEAFSRQTLSLSFQSAAAVDQMRREEERLLTIRTDESNRLYALTVMILAATFCLALILFFIHYRLLNNELGAREQAEQTARNGEQSLRHLTARLLQMQDEERRKFSRELHDSLGQYLAGVKMNLDMIARSGPDAGKSNDGMMENAIHLLDQSIAETRTISHLLHPPLLDEVGFTSAAKWYVEGFSERSRIEVQMDIPPDISRLPRPVELGLFRVLQESLTNIHRHSKSAKAEVKLKSDQREVVLQVKDYGKGIPQESLKAFQGNAARFGVGLSGMRERVRELGGSLDIFSGPNGTLVVVSLPL